GAERFLQARQLDVRHLTAQGYQFLDGRRHRAGHLLVERLEEPGVRDAHTEPLDRALEFLGVVGHVPRNGPLTRKTDGLGSLPPSRLIAWAGMIVTPRAGRVSEGAATAPVDPSASTEELSGWGIYLRRP